MPFTSLAALQVPLKRTLCVKHDVQHIISLYKQSRHSYYKQSILKFGDVGILADILTYF